MKNLIQNSTIHGISHIHSTRNKIYRTIWIILFIFGIGGIIFNVVIVSIKYLSYPVSTSYTLNYEPFIWPEFTFCNPTAPFYIKYNSSQHRVWNKLLEEFKHLNENKLKNQFIMASVDMQQMSVILARQIKHFQIYYDRGYFVNDKYENIDWLSSFNPKVATISSKMVSIFYNLPCHTLKLNHNLSYYDQVQSLKILFKLDYDSYEIFNSDFKPRSLYLYINEEDEFTKGKPFILTPGYKYVLDVSQSQYDYLGVDRPCRNEIFTSEIYDGNLQRTGLYEGNDDDCEKVLVQKYLMENCKCVLNFLPIPKNDGGFPILCFNLTMFSQSEYQSNMKCLKTLQENTSLNSDLDSKCSRYKLDKCYSTTYNIDVQKDDFIDKTRKINKRGLETLRKLYSKLYPKDPKNEEFVNIMRDNVLQIVVSRKRKFCDLYAEEYAYLFSQLLSDVGGLMGLWLGMSVVGLFELTHLFYFYTRTLCKCHPRNTAIPLTIEGTR